MNLSIIFWFYKEPEICLNRLELIKKSNPGIRIFGLFGGGKKDEAIFKKILGKHLDDFYASSYCEANKDWKWINGDLMILDWYEKRGLKLNWDSVAVIQWDMLVFDALSKIFPKIKNGQIYLSGLRVLDDFIENRWSWTKKGGQERANYLAFKKHIKKEFNYADDKILCSLFIFQIFPRIFFKKWLKIKNREIGMLEYKTPTYAKIFKTPFYQKDLGIRWFGDNPERKDTPMNARAIEIGEGFIKSELNKSDGYRLFHPYFKLWQ